MKRIVAILTLLSMMAVTTIGFAADGQYFTRYIRTTNDAAIDSVQVRNGKRMIISNIWAWYDNAANTNNFNVEIVEGMSQMAVQGTAGRVFKWSEAMTSAGIKSLAIPMFQNIITTADSTVYLSISATGSDTLLVAYTYKWVN